MLSPEQGWQLIVKVTAGDQSIKPLKTVILTTVFVLIQIPPLPQRVFQSSAAASGPVGQSCGSHKQRRVELKAEVVNPGDSPHEHVARRKGFEG